MTIDGNFPTHPKTQEEANKLYQVLANHMADEVIFRDGEATWAEARASFNYGLIKAFLILRHTGFRPPNGDVFMDGELPLPMKGQDLKQQPLRDSQVQVEAEDTVEFWANQAWREGMVLATIGKRALIAYRMPAGAIYMVLIDYNPDAPPAKRGLNYADTDLRSSYLKKYRYGSGSNLHRGYQSLSVNALKKSPKWMAEVKKVLGFEDGDVDRGLRFIEEELRE